MTFNFVSSEVREPREETLPEKVIFTWPALSLRRNATETLVTRKPLSLGPSFGRQTSCCPFCTVSFRLPVFAVMPKTAGCSSVRVSAASLDLLVVCARTGNAMQVDSPMTAARRVTLMVIPIAPKRVADGDRPALPSDAGKVKLHSSFLAGKRSTAQTSGGSD